MQTASGTTTFIPTNFGFKNRIINGAMVIAQQSTGSIANTITSSYGIDRFAFYGTQASKFTVQQNAGSVTLPAGFANYLGVTSSSAYTVGSTDTFVVLQQIEGNNFYDFAFGTVNAKTVTLSFQVYSSLTGTFGGSLRNYVGTRSYPFSYTISSANTWTQISITIPGDTSGTWAGATNSGAASLFFSLGSGSTYSGTAGTWASADYRSATGAVSVVGTNAATFYITGVQLEAGNSASSFDYRPYGTELNLCLRYAYQINSPNPSTGYAWDSTYTGAVAQALSSGDIRGVIPLFVPMRATPSAYYSNLAIFGNGANQTSTTLSVAGLSGSGVKINFGATGMTVGATYQLAFSGSTTGYLLLSAEL
jgi:hypothetical protein